MIQEHQSVVLKEDLPEDKLRKGDVGTIVFIHGQHRGYEVEFNTADGNGIAIVSLGPEQIRELSDHDVWTVRELVQ
jgi:Domain of unknown function (DUF4926)